MPNAPEFMRHEHEFEPEYGLPEVLPASEHKLWQGSPDPWQVTRRVFHWNKLALYFAVIVGWRVATLMGDGAGTAEVLSSLLRLVPLFALCLGLLALLGWLTARTTVYTLTDRRVVMRVGIVLTVTYNLPLRSMDAADLHPQSGGCGDIALALKPGTRIAYLHLWPHVRPWRYVQTQPMLRCVPGAQAVSEQLAMAWAQANQQVAQPVVDMSSVPQARPHGLAQPAMSPR